MLSAVIVGLIIGFIIGIPPGPVGVSAINFGLFKSFRHGFWYSSANGIMDFLYCWVTISATSALTAKFNSFSNSYSLTVMILQFTIILLLIVLGVMNLRTKKEEFSLSEKVRQRHQRTIHRFEDKGPFWFGSGIALTNLANPSYFGTLAYISINIHSFDLISDEFLSNTTFAFFFGIGNFLWLLSLIRLVRKYKHRLTDVMLMRVRKFAGVSFIAFGLFLGYKLISSEHFIGLIQ